jgi:hypothetical protein
MFARIPRPQITASIRSPDLDHEPPNKIAKDIRALASLVSRSMQARAPWTRSSVGSRPPDRRKGLLGMSARENE